MGGHELRPTLEDDLDIEDPQLGVDAMVGLDTAEPYQGPGGGAPSAIVEALQHYADDDKATITDDVDEVGAVADVNALTIDADVAIDTQAADGAVLDGGESGGLDTDFGELGDVVRANAGPDAGVPMSPAPAPLDAAPAPDVAPAPTDAGTPVPAKDAGAPAPATDADVPATTTTGDATPAKKPGRGDTAAQNANWEDVRTAPTDETTRKKLDIDWMPKGVLPEVLDSIDAGYSNTKHDKRRRRQSGRPSPSSTRITRRSWIQRVTRSRRRMGSRVTRRSTASKISRRSRRTRATARRRSGSRSFARIATQNPAPYTTRTSRSRTRRSPSLDLVTRPSSGVAARRWHARTSWRGRRT